MPLPSFSMAAEPAKDTFASNRAPRVPSCDTALTTQGLPTGVSVRALVAVRSK